MTSLTDTTHESEPQHKVRELVFPTTVEPAEVAFAEQALAALPVAVTFAERDQVGEWQHADGRWFRWVGVVAVRWEGDGPHRFRIVLRHGATETDLEWLQGIVSRAKLGGFGERHGWLPSRAHAGVYEFRWARQIDAPGRRHGETLTPCTNSWCPEDMHAGLPMHEYDRIDGDGWDITVMAYENKPAFGYFALSANEFTAEQLVSIANDLLWSAAEIRRHNTPQAVPLGA